VTSAVPGFIALEIRRGFTSFGGFVPAFGCISAVAMLRIVGIVDLALEVGGTVEPGSSAEE